MLVFSQFVAMIDLLDDYLRTNGVDTATYTGQMSKDERDEVLADFKRPDGPRVLIIRYVVLGIDNTVLATRLNKPPMGSLVVARRPEVSD